MPKRPKPVPRDDQWSEGDIKNVLCNPFHVYNGTISADMWIKAMVRLVEESGLEETLRRLAAVYDEAMGAQGKIEEALAEHLISSFAEGAGKLPLEELFRSALAGLDPAQHD